MLVQDAIAEILKREGVETLIGYPVNPMFDAAARADIRTVVVRQERIGVHMADSFSRMSSGQEIGVFTMQSGPGTENAFGAVAQAFSESVPLVVIAGGYARSQTNVVPVLQRVWSTTSTSPSRCEQVTVAARAAGHHATRLLAGAQRPARPRVDRNPGRHVDRRSAGTSGATSPCIRRAARPGPEGRRRGRAAYWSRPSAR